MNLAVLTGRQVSKPLKVFIVSYGGEIADVTLHSSCSSTEPSALKVTSSCTSVYVDGSETRGAVEAEIQVKYGSFAGSAAFTVWMPTTPMFVELDDTKLSQVKGWKVPVQNDYQDQSPATDPVEMFTRRKRSKAQETETRVPRCEVRYQQTKVRVYAEFLAEDPESGRKEYFPSRGTQLEVTELLLEKGLKVTNPRVATLRGNVVIGQSPGRTDIRVSFESATFYYLEFFFLNLLMFRSFHRFLAKIWAAKS